MALLFLFLLLSGLSIAQAPVKADQVTTERGQYETAVWIDQYVEQEGMEYPKNYVFSEWDSNRFYNYHVNGQSSSYGFALNNYERFASSESFGNWSERLQGKVGFIVLPRSGYAEGTVHYRLTRALGSRFEGYNGSGHYRALYATESHQVHQLVPGANVTGTLRNGSQKASNTTIFLRTNIEVAGNGHETPYIRRVTTDSEGRYSVRVAYPGSYEVLTSDGTIMTNVTVSESAVETGERVDAGTFRSENGTATDGRTRLRSHQVSPS